MVLEYYRNRYKSYGITGGIFSFLNTLTQLLFFTIIIFSFLFNIVVVDGSSMRNTLFKNDCLLASNFKYEAKNSDIVIISRNFENSEDGRNLNLYEKPIVKRVIALEGQKVDIKNNRIYIDDKMLEESYINTKTIPYDFKGPQIVPQGKIFVLGDNRKNSKDSRSLEIGMVDKRYVIGKVILRFYPFEAIKFF